MDLLTVVFLILGFLLTIATAIFSYRDKHRAYKRNNLKSDAEPQSKEYRIVFGIALIAALMTLFSNILSGYKSVTSAEKAKALNDSLIAKSDALIKSQQLNTSLLLEQKDSTKIILGGQGKLQKSQEDLAEANKKIQQLQDQLYINITSKGNFPKVIVSQASPSKNYHNISLFVSNRGKTPLRGLKASISDAFSILKSEYNSGQSPVVDFEKPYDENDPFRSFLEKEKKIDIGYLPPGNGKVFYYIRVPRAFDFFFASVNISWENGYYLFSIQGKVPPNKREPVLSVKPIWASKGLKLDSTKIEAQNFLND